jgi:carbonic anhydrase
MFSHATATLFAALSLSGPFLSSAAEGDYSYDPLKDNGPQNWATLSIENNQCGGDMNSPVAVTSKTQCDRQKSYVMNAGDCAVSDLTFEVLNNGVIAKFPESGCTSNTVQIPDIDGTYKALQYHIHTDSEHSIDNQFFDFELHVVHQLVEGSGSGAGPSGESNGFAVVGFVIQNGGETNAQFDQLLNSWQASREEVLGSSVCAGTSRKLLQASSSSKNNVRRVQDSFDIYSLINGNNFYHYSGGLTTPPCSEVVWWNLATEPVVISDEQGALLQEIILDYRNSTCDLATLADPVTGTTSRAPQPLNGRVVELNCPTAESTSTTDNGSSTGTSTGSGDSTVGSQSTSGARNVAVSLLGLMGLGVAALM